MRGKSKENQTTRYKNKKTGGTMYPYAGHLAVGLAGIALFPSSAPLQVAWLVGSLLPDTPATIQSVADRLRGKPELIEQSPAFLRVQEIVNSMLICLALWVLLMWRAPNLPSSMFQLCGTIITAYFIHLVIDAFTHSGEEYKATDPSYLWPFSRPRLGARIGIWEYRNGVGLKMPLVPELVFSAVVPLATIWLRFF